MTSPSPSPRPRKRTDAAGTVESPAVTDIAPLAAPIEVPPVSIAAGPMTVTQGAIGRADATSLEVHQGAVGGARADNVAVERSALGIAVASEVQVRQGVVGSILAGSARVEQSFVRTLVAGEVKVEHATGVGILLARKVVGDVKVILDWRGALAFGAAAGIVAGLLGRGRNRGSKGPDA